MGIDVNKDYDINQLISNIDFSSGTFHDIGHGIMLTNQEIEVLNRYQIPYQKCISLKEIIFEIEEVIPDLDDSEELDYISSLLAERDYYQNTNK